MTRFFSASWLSRNTGKGDWVSLFFTRRPSLGERSLFRKPNPQLICPDGRGISALEWPFLWDLCQLGDTSPVDRLTVRQCVTTWTALRSFNGNIGLNKKIIRDKIKTGSELLCTHQQAFRAYGRWAHTAWKHTHKCTEDEQFHLANSK